jgi:exopolysaccharide production protein ExoZ
LTSFFILEFIAGWFLYQYHHRLLQRWLWPLWVIGLILSVASGVHLDARNDLARIYTFGVAGVFLVALCFWLEKRCVYKANDWLVRLGDASYAIYLFHVPLMVLFSHWGVWQRYSTDQQGIPEVAVLVFLGLLCSLCVLYYENIEKPLYRAACQKISFHKTTT